MKANCYFNAWLLVFVYNYCKLFKNFVNRSNTRNVMEFTKNIRNRNVIKLRGREPPPNSSFPAQNYVIQRSKI